MGDPIAYERRSCPGGGLRTGVAALYGTIGGLRSIETDGPAVVSIGHTRVRPSAFPERTGSRRTRVERHVVRDLGQPGPNGQIS